MHRYVRGKNHNFIILISLYIKKKSIRKYPVNMVNTLTKANKQKNVNTTTVLAMNVRQLQTKVNNNTNNAGAQRRPKPTRT